MDRRDAVPSGTYSAALLAAMLLLPSTGCVGLVANLIYAAGETVPAAFDGLRGQKVAVVCVSDASTFGPSNVNDQLAQRIGDLLVQRVREIRVIGQPQISRWRDENDWNELDFLALGKGVGADRVLAVEIGAFSLHDGPTMFKGRAEVGVVVYDVMQPGQPVFRIAPRQVQFPSAAGQYTTDMSEAEFRQKFTAVIAHQVARNFYAYDLKEDFALDATLISP